MAQIDIPGVTLLSSLSLTFLSATKSNWSFHLICVQSIHLFLPPLPLSQSKSPSSSFLHYSNSLTNRPWHPLLLLSNLGVNPVNSLKHIDLLIDRSDLSVCPIYVFTDPSIHPSIDPHTYMHILLVLCL